MDITQAFKIALIKKGVKQVDISKKLGLTRNAVSHNILSGDSMSIKTASRLADAMGYSVRIQLVDKETGEVIEA